MGVNHYSFADAVYGVMTATGDYNAYDDDDDDDGNEDYQAQQHDSMKDKAGKGAKDKPQTKTGMTHSCLYSVSVFSCVSQYVTVVGK